MNNGIGMNGLNLSEIRNQLKAGGYNTDNLSDDALTSYLMQNPQALFGMGLEQVKNALYQVLKQNQKPVTQQQTPQQSNIGSSNNNVFSDSVSLGNDPSPYTPSMSFPGKTPLTNQQGFVAIMAAYVPQNNNSKFGIGGAAPTGVSDPSSYSESPSSSIDSENDSDLKPFDKEEVMANPGCCGMGANAADSAKPEQQQNLRECKAVKKAIKEMQKQDSDSSELSSALSELEDNEKLIRSTLKRGRGKTDEIYKSMGIDPNDKEAVHNKVKEMAKKTFEIANNIGINIEVSKARGQRMGIKSQKSSQGNANGIGGPSNNQEASPMSITTGMVDKQKQLTPDEIEQNQALSQSIMQTFQQLLGQALAAQQQKMAIPQAIALPPTPQGSPIAQAFNQGSQNSQAGATQSPPLFGNMGAPAAGTGASMPQAGGISAGASNVSDIQIGQISLQDLQAAQGGGVAAMMQAMGMSTLTVTVQVYDPNMAIQVSGNQGGGVSVGSGLKGNSINLKMPKLVAKGQDGKMYKIGALKKSGDGTYNSTVKGITDTAAAGPAGAIHVDGSDVNVLPGTKAA